MQICSAKMVVNIDRVLIEMLMCRDGASCRPSTASTYSSPSHGEYTIEFLIQNQVFHTFNVRLKINGCERI